MHPTCSAYISWNNGQILMFKVSKWLYWGSWYDENLHNYVFLPIKSEIMDRFWCSRCLNDCIDLLYMIGSFACGANVSLVAKNGTKKIIPLLSIKSSEVDKEASNKKFHKTDPPQKWKFWFKLQFQNFQNPKINLRK